MITNLLKPISRAALAILMLAAFAQTPVFAQEIINDEQNVATDEQSVEQTQEKSSAKLHRTRRLEGVWNIQVTGRNCLTGDAIRTFPSMFTMMRGGTMKEWGSGLPPATRGSGHGVWSHDSGRRYTSAFQFFRFNADGTYAGRQIIRQQIRLSNDGNSFTSTATAQVLDTAGNVLATNCSTGVATRFQ